MCLVPHLRIHGLIQCHKMSLPKEANWWRSGRLTHMGSFWAHIQRLPRIGYQHTQPRIRGCQADCVNRVLVGVLSPSHGVNELKTFFWLLEFHSLSSYTDVYNPAWVHVCMMRGRGSTARVCACRYLTVLAPFEKTILSPTDGLGTPFPSKYTLRASILCRCRAGWPYFPVRGCTLLYCEPWEHVNEPPFYFLKIVNPSHLKYLLGSDSSPDAEI